MENTTCKPNSVPLMHTAAIHDNNFYGINENDKTELYIQLSTINNTTDGEKQIDWLNYWVRRVKMICDPGISLLGGKYSSIQLPECNLFYIAYQSMLLSFGASICLFRIYHLSNRKECHYWVRYFLWDTTDITAVKDERSTKLFLCLSISMVPTVF